VELLDERLERLFLWRRQALLAVGAPCASVASTEALFRCGVKALAPVAR